MPSTRFFVHLEIQGSTFVLATLEIALSFKILEYIDIFQPRRNRVTSDNFTWHWPDRIHWSAGRSIFVFNRPREVPVIWKWIASVEHNCGSFLEHLVKYKIHFESFASFLFLNIKHCSMCFRTFRNNNITLAQNFWLHIWMNIPVLFRYQGLSNYKVKVIKEKMCCYTLQLANLRPPPHRHYILWLLSSGHLVLRQFFNTAKSLGERQRIKQRAAGQAGLTNNGFIIRNWNFLCPPRGQVVEPIYHYRFH